MTELDQEIIRPRGVEPIPHKYKVWEQKENIVDIDFETLRLFLDFIYETND